MGNVCSNNYSETNNQNYEFSNQIIENKINRNSSILSNSLSETNSAIFLKSNTQYKLFFPLNNNFNNSEKEIIINNKITLINSNIKGFLLRKKYKEYLKLDLMDFTNELYFQFLFKSRNKKVSEIINNDNNGKIIELLRTNWSEFYKEDPNKDVNIEINKSKKYINGFIFKYKQKNFHSDNIEKCLKYAAYCYKGSVDIYTNSKCGYGELTYSDGSQKLGIFYNDEFRGWNTYINSDGILFVGYFVKDKLNGKGLKYDLENDHLYKGDFADNLRHGYGTDIRKTSKYEGQFFFDKKCGKGQVILKAGDIYKGEFKDNRITGFGHYIWKGNHHEYIGNFLDGKFHGEGMYKFGNNQYFKGTYNNGIKEGKGVLVDQNNNIIKTELDMSKVV